MLDGGIELHMHAICIHARLLCMPTSTFIPNFLRHCAEQTVLGPRTRALRVIVEYGDGCSRLCLCKAAKNHCDCLRLALPCSPPPPTPAPPRHRPCKHISSLHRASHKYQRIGSPEMPSAKDG